MIWPSNMNPRWMNTTCPHANTYYEIYVGMQICLDCNVSLGESNAMEFRSSHRFVLQYCKLLHLNLFEEKEINTIVEKMYAKMYDVVSIKSLVAAIIYLYCQSNTTPNMTIEQICYACNISTHDMVIIIEQIISKFVKDICLLCPSHYNYYFKKMMKIAQIQNSYH